MIAYAHLPRLVGRARSIVAGALVIGLSLGLTTRLEATEVIPPTFDELVNQADYVVRARVDEVQSEIRPNGGRGMIVSLVRLDVREVIVGEPPAELILTVVGGRVGDREMYIEGAPRFAVGTEAVFFVKGNGRQMYPLVAMMHGLYPIVREKPGGVEYVSRANQTPLWRTADVGLPITETGSSPDNAERTSPPPMTPEKFGQQIRTMRKTEVSPANDE